MLLFQLTFELFFIQGITCLCQQFSVFFFKPHLHSCFCILMRLHVHVYMHICEQINFTIAELFCTWAIQVREVIRIISSLACYWKKSSGLNSNFPIIVFFFLLNFLSICTTNLFFRCWSWGVETPIFQVIIIP